MCYTMCIEAEETTREHTIKKFLQKKRENERIFESEREKRDKKGFLVAMREEFQCQD